MKTKIKTNGRYFTRLREKQNLTIKELSQKTNISQSTLSNIENDKVIPQLRTLLKLVKFFNITFKEAEMYILSDSANNLMLWYKQILHIFQQVHYSSALFRKIQMPVR